MRDEDGMHGCIGGVLLACSGIEVLQHHIWRMNASRIVFLYRTIMSFLANSISFNAVQVNFPRSAALLLELHSSLPASFNFVPSSLPNNVFSFHLGKPHFQL
jgi:hypothetical protein